MTVVDRNLVSLAAQPVGGGKPGRAAADDADSLLALDAGPGRLHPALGEGCLDDMALDRADGHRVEILLDDAIALAQPVLGADAPANLGEGVGRRCQGVGLFKAVIGGQHEPIGNVVAQGTMDLTVGDAALGTARRLIGGPFGLKILVDFREIPAPVDGIALLRRLAVEGYEF